MLSRFQIWDCWEGKESFKGTKIKDLRTQKERTVVD
jgi:hypothetical protein